MAAAAPNSTMLTWELAPTFTPLSKISKLNHAHVGAGIDVGADGAAKR